MRTHSQVKAPPPYHLGRDIVANLHTAMGEGKASRAHQQLFAQLLNSVRRLGSADQAVRLEVWLKANEPTPGELFRFVYGDLDEAAKGELTFVKENNLHKLFLFTQRYFPNAKYIFQVRDPRDFLASALARRNHWLGNKFGSISNALSVWREDQIGGLLAMSLLGPERVMVQRYEDLVSDPHAVLSAATEFLDIEFEDNMLNFHQADQSQRMAAKGGPRENLSKPLMTGNFGKYRNALSRRQIKTVERYLGDLMVRFGYELDFPNGAPSRAGVLWQSFMEPVERFVNHEKRPFYSSMKNKFAYRVEADMPPLAFRYVASDKRDE